MSFDILKKKLKDSSLPQLLVLYGDEEYLKEFYYKKIISNSSSSSSENELVVFDGKNIDAQQLAEAIETIPFFNDKKIVVIKDVVLSADNEAAAYIKSTADALPDYITLIFYLDSVKLNDNKTYEKVLKNITGEKALFVDFKSLTYNELKDWVYRLFKKQGYEIDGKIIEYFLSVCDNSMLSIKNESEKIINYTDNKNISKNLIDKLATKSSDAKIYDLTNAILSKNKDDVFIILNELLTQGVDVHILAASVYNKFYELYLIKSAIDSGISNKDIGKDLSIKNEYALSKTISNSKQVSTLYLKKCIDICHKADYKLKLTQVDNRIILELFIGEILNLSC